MILHQLKQATRCDHEQIERTMDLETRCRSLDGYRELLVCFYGFYAPVEMALAQVDGLSAMLDDLDRRYKTGLLAQDLAILGLSPSDLAALPRCDKLPDLSGVAQALGCLYVLEGATLGGQIIARQIHQNLGMTAAEGCAFFSSYGQQTGSMWRMFGTHLVGYTTTPQCADAILMAAQDTFHTFEQWLVGNRT